MTAAPSSERRPIWTKALAAVVSAAVAWTPWALVWGDVFSDAAASGQATGTAARAAVQRPATAGQSVVLPGGNMDFGALFQSVAGGDPATFASLYGNHEGTMIRGQQAQIDLLSAGSPTGSAYRALRSSVDRSHPDMRNDPGWRQTDDMLDGFGQCQTTTTFANTQRQAHIAEYRTCDRLVEQGGICSWYHDYEMPPEDTLRVTGSSNATFASCGIDCVRVTMSGDPIPYVYYTIDGNIEIADPARVTSITASISVGEAPAPDESQIPEGYVLVGTYTNELAVFGAKYFSSLADVNDADVTEWLRSGGTVRAAYSTTYVYQFHCPDSQDPLCPRWLYHYIQVAHPLELTLDIHFRLITDPSRDVWGPNDGCYKLLDAVTSGSCPGKVECLGVPPLADSGCYEAPGVRICPGNMSQPPVAGQNPFCREIRVSADCASRHTGQMQCWTDPQGVEHCPYNSGGQASDCLELEQNPNCGFLKSECVTGAVDARGDCWLFTETWDCGYQRPVPALQRIQSVDCAGPVRCMGAECASFPSESSSDFGKAVAALQAVQMAITDMECTSATDCEVFGGERNECKRAVGGVVNCCKTPEGISLGEYINLVFAVSKLDSATLAMNKDSTIRGAWETLRQPVTWTWETIQQSWTSISNNLMGNTAASASDTASELGLSAFKQLLMRQTVEWTVSIFGEAATNALFSVVAGGQAGPAVTGGSVNAGTLQLGGGTAWAGTVMVWVMYAYMIYTVVMILVKIIWECEKAEFELGAKRELRACHRVGAYCKSEVLGVCVERRDSYCCFNTPLARILNEQVRPQLGRDWGAANNPDCSGIRVSELAQVDWSQVNLDEWLSILLEAGRFPTAPTLTLDNLTGSGSDLALQSEGRPNAAQRAVERAQGLDSYEVRKEAQYELYGGSLNTLPGQ